MNERVSMRQMLLWIASAVSAPLAIYGGSASWEWTLVIGAVSTAAVILTLKFGEGDYGVLLRVLQLGVLAVAAGTFAADISACWGKVGVSMPLTLIALAALSAIGGAERAGRVSCVAAWIVAILYIVVLAAGVKNIDISRLEPNGRANGMLVVAYLLPAVSLMLPREQGKGLGWLFVVPVFASVISLWCSGTLSQNAATEVEIPFYEYSKSLNLLGVAERFEALASVALTLGMFCLLSLMFSAAEHVIKNGAVIGAVGAAIIVSGIEVGTLILCIAAAVSWVILPVAKSLVKNRKNVKKCLTNRTQGVNICKRSGEGHNKIAKRKEI